MKTLMYIITQAQSRINRFRHSLNFHIQFLIKALLKERKTKHDRHSDYTPLS